MTLTQHSVLTGIAAVALAPLLHASELILFVIGGVLIDVDHYLLYIQRRRDLSIPGMFRYFSELQPIQTNIPYVGLCIFHTLDFFILLAVLANFYPKINCLLAGCLFHFVIDLFYLRHKKIILIRPFCLFEHFIRRRSKGYPWY